MYFCPNCSYILDVVKSSNIAKKDDDRIIIPKPNNIFKLLEDNVDLSNYKADFLKDEIFKNKKYQKLSDNEKNKINELFLDNLVSGAEFKCYICNYSKQIMETTLLYKISLDNTYNINNIEDNELIIKNPILPHTRDYTCKNPSCITHKKPELKDSVFLHERKSFKLNYICTVCFFSW